MNTLKLAAVLAATLTLAACGSDDEARIEAEQEAARQAALEAQRAAQEAPSFEKALTQLGAAFGAGDSEKVETVSARTLKDMLPEKLGKLTRSSFSAQKNGAMGFNVTTAEATYTDDDGKSITLDISDIGAMQGLASLGMGWVNMEIDEESDQGFRRSLEYKGHRAFQNYSTAGSRSEGNMSVVVNGRFIVNVTGVDVPFEQIEEVVEALPIAEFEKLSRDTAPGKHD